MSMAGLSGGEAMTLRVNVSGHQGVGRIRDHPRNIATRSFNLKIPLM